MQKYFPYIIGGLVITNIVVIYELYSLQQKLAPLEDTLNKASGQVTQVDDFLTNFWSSIKNA